MANASKKEAIDLLTPRAKLKEAKFHDLLGYQLAQASIMTDLCFKQSLVAHFQLTKIELTLLHLINENNLVTTSLLAKALRVSLPAITMWMAKLEKRQLVIRERSTTDLRSQYFTLTEAAKQHVELAINKVCDAENQMLANLSAAEKAILLELLRKVARSSMPKK
jgi:DNA-binding MarR family transcriptional regulator